MKLTIKDIKREAENIKLFRFTLQEPFSFFPGQSISLTINDPKNNIINQKRYYSIASSPTETHHLDILVKDNPTSVVGHYVYTALQVGDSLDIQGPYGNMCLQTPPKNVTFIAAGSGVAPFLSMIKCIREKNPATDITLFYSTKKLEETAFYDEFTDLSHQGHFRYIHTLTQDQNWKGNKGRITKELLQKNLSTTEGLFFICGPTPMVKDMFTILKELGIEEEAIIIERY